MGQAALLNQNERIQRKIATNWWLPLSSGTTTSTGGVWGGGWLPLPSGATTLTGDTEGAGCPCLAVCLVLRWPLPARPSNTARPLSARPSNTAWPLPARPSNTAWPLSARPYNTAWPLSARPSNWRVCLTAYTRETATPNPSIGRCGGELQTFKKEFLEEMPVFFPFLPPPLNLHAV